MGTPTLLRLRAPALTAALLGLPTLLLRLHDPHVPYSWGVCPVLLLTGHPCPLCGGLRAVNDLTRGDLTAALASNVLVVAGIPVVLLAWAVWVRRRVAGIGPQEPPLPSAAGSWLLLALVLTFGLVRNTPWGTALAP